MFMMGQWTSGSSGFFKDQEKEKNVERDKTRGRVLQIKELERVIKPPYSHLAGQLVFFMGLR
jgi:hypothetical protein